MNIAQKPWTAWEETWLAKNYPTMSVSACAAFLGRSAGSVTQRAHRLQIAKTYGHKLPETVETTPVVHPAVRDEPFIRPIPLSRLMGQR